MSTPLIDHLLSADDVIVPFEQLDGRRQVAVLIMKHSGQYISYDLVDDDRIFQGAIAVMRSRLSSEDIDMAMNRSESDWINFKAQKVVVESVSVKLQDEIITAVQKMSITTSTGKLVELVDEGGFYPYNMILSQVGGDFT